jgi:hypothetical protein
MGVVTSRLVNVPASTRLRRSRVPPEKSEAAINYDLFHYVIIWRAFQNHHQRLNVLPMGIAPAVSVTTVGVQSWMAEEAEERWEVILLYW